MYKFIGKKNRCYELEIKLNSNCPASEKNGTGPGSCGGSNSKNNTNTSMKPSKLINNIFTDIALTRDDMIKMRAIAFRKTYPDAEFDENKFRLNWEKSDDYKNFKPISPSVSNEILLAISDIKSKVPEFRDIPVILSANTKSGIDTISDAHADQTGFITMHQIRQINPIATGPNDKNYLYSGSLYENEYAGTFAHEAGHVISFRDRSVIQRATNLKAKELNLEGRLDKLSPMEIAAECESIYHGQHLNKFNKTTQRAIEYVVTGKSM